MDGSGIPLRVPSKLVDGTRRLCMPYQRLSRWGLQVKGHHAQVHGTPQPGASWRDRYLSAPAIPHAQDLN